MTGLREKMEAVKGSSEREEEAVDETYAKGRVEWTVSKWLECLSDENILRIMKHVTSSQPLGYKHVVWSQTDRHHRAIKRSEKLYPLVWQSSELKDRVSSLKEEGVVANYDCETTAWGTATYICKLYFQVEDK